MPLKVNKSNLKTAFNAAASHGNTFIDIDGFVPHYILDLSIKDLKERIEHGYQCESASQAAFYLGVSLETVMKNRVVGTRVRGYNGKLYAVRLGLLSEIGSKPKSYTKLQTLHPRKRNPQ